MKFQKFFYFILVFENIFDSFFFLDPINIKYIEKCLTFSLSLSFSISIIINPNSNIFSIIEIFKISSSVS